MNIDSLDASSWDVLIAGTGLHESLLALALSRSGKKILHVDRNQYYGGSDAALSLQEATDWANTNSGANATAPFTNARVSEHPLRSTAEGMPTSQLSFPRAYSLALSPQIIYAQSSILPALVSSKVDQQLDFLAVGSCFVYAPNNNLVTDQEDVANLKGRLFRVPNSREDIFADEDLEPKHKRGLMKFLRFISDFEEQRDTWKPFQSEPFDAFLSSQFNLPPAVQQPLHALTLSQSPPGETTTSFALPRVARHLRSIGMFGPGFGSVVPKWGGLAEIAQVGCRACAVGGGVYVLGNGLEAIQPSMTTESPAARSIQVQLKRGEVVTTDWVVAGQENHISSQIPPLLLGEHARDVPDTVHRSICIVSSTLSELFPKLADGAPRPAAAVVVIPSSSLVSDQYAGDGAPIYVMVHSSDTGECPTGQSILYASIPSSQEMASSLLDKATAALLQSINEQPKPQILWKLEYDQHSRGVRDDNNAMSTEAAERVLTFPPLPQDLAFNDSVMRCVRDAWQKIMGLDGGDFLMFSAREEMNVEDDDG